MFRSKFVVPALSAVCLLASQAVVPSAALASTMRADVPVHAIFSTAKMVSVNVANNTGSELSIMVGEAPMTIAAGKTVKVSATPGTKITVATASATHAAGSILAEITRDISGATIRIN